MKRLTYLIVIALFFCVNTSAQTITIATYGVSDNVWNSQGKYVQIKRTGSTTFETGVMLWRPSSFTKPIKVDVVVFLETSSGVHDVSDTLKFTSSDFVGFGMGSSTKPISCTIAASMLTNTTTAKLKVKYRYYKEQYPSPDNQDGWTAMLVAPGDKNYSILDVKYEPIPSTFSGPSQICSEGIYTVSNPGTVTLVNASGIATLTALGNNQWKVTRTGNASGTVTLRSTVGSQVYNFHINVNSTLAGTISGTTAIKQGWSNRTITFTPAEGTAYSNYDWTIYAGSLTMVKNGNSVSISVPRNYPLYDTYNGDLVDLVLTAQGECGTMTKVIQIRILPAQPTNPPTTPGE